MKSLPAFVFTWISLSLLAYGQVRSTATPNPQDVPQRGPVQSFALVEELNTEVSLQVTEMPLRNVLVKLSEDAGVTIILDEKAFDDLGIPPDVPVTLRLQDQPLKTILRYLGQDLDLQYMVRENVILLSSVEECESNLVTRIYRITDEDADLEQLIQQTISPEFWWDLGGPGGVKSYGNLLTISATDPIHDQVTSFLETLNRLSAMTPQERSVSEPLSLTGEDKEDQTLRAMLTRQVQFPKRDREVSLKQWSEDLSQRLKIPVRMDGRAMDEFGISGDIQVPSIGGPMSAHMQIATTLDAVDLTYRVRDGILHITTEEAEESNTVCRVYPVENLVTQLPIESGVPLPLISLIQDAPDLGTMKVLQGIKELQGLQTYDQLIALITMHIEPDSWEEVGGPGIIIPLPVYGCLLVNTYDEVHRNLTKFLRQLRQAEPTSLPLKLKTQPDEYMVQILFRVNHPPESQLDLASVIEQTVDPIAWRDQGTHVVSIPGGLIVRAPIPLMRKVASMLQSMGVMVSPGGGGLGTGSGAIGPASGFFSFPPGAPATD